MSCYCDDIYGFTESLERAQRNKARSRVIAKYYAMPLKVAKDQEVSDEPVINGLKWHMKRNTATPKKRKLAELDRYIERAKAGKAFTGPEMQSQGGSFGYYRCVSRAGHPSFRRQRKHARAWEQHAARDGFRCMVGWCVRRGVIRQESKCTHPTHRRIYLYIRRVRRYLSKVWK